MTIQIQIVVMLKLEKILCRKLTFQGTQEENIINYSKQNKLNCVK